MYYLYPSYFKSQGTLKGTSLLELNLHIYLVICDPIGLDAPWGQEVLIFAAGLFLNPL